MMTDANETKLKAVNPLAALAVEDDSPMFLQYCSGCGVCRRQRRGVIEPTRGACAETKDHVWVLDQEVEN